MYNINNFTAVCAKYVHFTLHLLCCLLVHPDKFLILCKWLLRYYYWTYYSDMRHGDRPHNYVYNYIFGFAISSGLTKILPIEKCIIFLDTLYTTDPMWIHLQTNWSGALQLLVECSIIREAIMHIYCRDTKYILNQSEVYMKSHSIDQGLSHMSISSEFVTQGLIYVSNINLQFSTWSCCVLGPGRILSSLQQPRNRVSSIHPWYDVWWPRGRESWFYDEFWTSFPTPWICKEHESGWEAVVHCWLPDIQIPLNGVWQSVGRRGWNEKKKKADIKCYVIMFYMYYTICEFQFSVDT